jgi:GTPase
MFVDELALSVRGGRGGNGAVSFRREKYVPKGGPDGGDGGDGGSVYLVADPSKHSFLDLRYRRIFKATDGGHGRTKNRHGARGTDLFIQVPLGTIARDDKNNIIADLTSANQRALVVAGGKGGKGNARFAGSRIRAPRLAERGLPGEEKQIYLELKLLAQVGLVGFPNAGKSTLLRSISEAKPKVADYPFTTLAPNLGVVRVGDEGSFVVADLPGLVEGAHGGAGLGHQFLRHVERNLLLLFLIDLSPQAHPEPEEAYSQLKKELTLYSSRLSKFPRVVVGNKLDLSGSAERFQTLQEKIRAEEEGTVPVFAISAATKEGVSSLIRFLFTRVNELSEGKSPLDEEEIIRPFESDHLPLQVEKVDAIYVVTGTAVERAAAKTDFENEEAVLRFQNYCRRIGLEKELKKKGIKEGDTVRIGEEEFFYYD